MNEVFERSFFIGGDWKRASSTRRRELVSPLSERVWTEVALAADADIDDAIDAAKRALARGQWASAGPAERARYLRSLADELEKRLPDLSRAWCAQVGTPVKMMPLFVGFAPATFRYFADLCERYPFESTHDVHMGRGILRREPAGVAALIVPWNAAIPVLSYKLAAALAAGCTTIIKPSPDAPLEPLIFAQAAQGAGLPAGVVNVLTADKDESQRLVASPDVNKVSFTGSTEVGKDIARTCIDRLARFTLELGGKSAAVILDDANLDAAMPALAPFTMPAAGQACLAQTRILAPRSRYDEVIERYCGIMSSLVVGDPSDRATDIGPLINKRQMERTLRYIETAKAEGARLATGGQRPTHLNSGYFVEPTVFADVQPDMVIAREEVFGPVVVVLPYNDEKEAIEIANATDFGLSGTVFGQDEARALDVARRIKTGHIGINAFNLDPSLPFGGYKQSGVGREGGEEGLEAFLETKVIYTRGVQ